MNCSFRTTAATLSLVVVPEMAQEPREQVHASDQDDTLICTGLTHQHLKEPT